MYWSAVRASEGCYDVAGCGVAEGEGIRIMYGGEASRWACVAYGALG